MPAAFCSQCIHSGLPGRIAENFLDHMFWCFVQGVGQLFHRLWLPYNQYPWKMAGLLDSETSLPEKHQLASEFLQLLPCCLNDWWGKQLRAHALNVHDLLPGGSCVGLLKACFNGKIFNIEVETNFARMQSMKRVGRGRVDLASSLCAKHVLAEAKLSHVRDHMRTQACSEQLHSDEAGVASSRFCSLIYLPGSSLGFFRSPGNNLENMFFSAH